MALNKAQILGKIKSTKVVPIKSLDGEIIIRSLPASEILDLSEQYQEKKISQADFTYRLIVMSVIDDDGNRIFDVDMVKDVDVVILSEIVTAVATFNGLDIEVLKNKAKEEAKKALSLPDAS